MWTLLLTAALAAGADAGLEVTAQNVASKPVFGRLISLNPEKAAIATAAGEASLAAKDLIAIAPSTPAALTKDKTPVWVELVDGSVIAAAEYAVSKAAAKIQLLSTGAADQASVIQLPTATVHSVRFGTLKAQQANARQWSEISRSKAASDLLVVRKKSALDYLEGVLRDVDAENVKFQLDSELVPVKRAKVEGLIYYHAAAEELANPACQVSDTHGSRLLAKSVVLRQDRLELVTTAGLQIGVPLADLVRIDFSSGKVQYLGDLEPESLELVPFLGLKDEVPAVASMFRPRSDRSLDQTPLRLGGVTYAKGLAIHSGTTLAYRLPGKFKQFHAIVGIDDAVRPGGDLKLRIKGDGKVLWEDAVRGKDRPKPIDLDVAGVKRLEISVEFGSDLDVADHLDLCDARVTK